MCLCGLCCDVVVGVGWEILVILLYIDNGFLHFDFFSSRRRKFHLFERMKVDT